MKNLVCFAVKEEGAFFKAGQGVQVLYTGMGGENARKAISKQFQRKTPCHVISSGFAGGLDPTLKLGAVIFNSQDDAVSKALQKQGARGCNFLPSDRVAITVAEKQRLRASSGADAVEMESHAIADLCRESNIPFSIVRVISDTALEDLPLDFNEIMTRDKRISFLKLAFRITTMPGAISKLISFRRRTIFAAKQLATVLSELTESIS